MVAFGKSYKVFLDYKPDRIAWIAGVQIEDRAGVSIAPLVAPAERKDRHQSLDTDAKLFMEEKDMKAFLQAVVNEAYQKLNITPAGWSSEVKAQAYHLEDMRKLVLKDKS